MSLILDALKRAERERKLGQAPAALDELALPPASPKRGPGRRPVVLGVAAVTIAGLAVFAYLRSQHPAPSAVETETAALAAEPVAVAPAGEDSQSARIEDGAEIATLDDLTGDTAGATDTAAASAELAAADEPAEPAGADVQPTLVTPSSLQTRAAPAPNSDARTAVKAEPAAPVAKPAAIAASKPAAEAKPKAKPAPPVVAAAKPAVKPAAAAKPAPVAKAIAAPVEVAAAPPVAEVYTGPHVAPPGPVIRFGNGPMEVIEPPPRPVRVPPPPPPLPPPPAPAPVAEVTPAAAAPEPVAVPVEAATDAAAVSSAPEAEAAHVESPAPAQAPKPAPVAAAAPRRAAAPPPPTAHPDPYASTRRLKDMPPGYRAEFPPISIDVHAYNGNPQKRFVLINGRRYREGDVISEGPRIAQIVAEGIVFDWRNEQVLYGSR